MISDVLFHAVDEIRRYQRDTPKVYADLKPQLDQLLEQMDSLRIYLDTPLKSMRLNPVSDAIFGPADFGDRRYMNLEQNKQQGSEQLPYYFRDGDAEPELIDMVVSRRAKEFIGFIRAMNAKPEDLRQLADDIENRTEYMEFCCDIRAQPHELRRFADLIEDGTIIL
jgi:hypothetical protein